MSRYRQLVIEDMVGNANRIELDGQEGIEVNSSFSNVDTDLGTALMEHYQLDLAVIWYETQGRVKVSLRSRGAVDAEKLAKKYDGGGHMYAAGFNLPLKSEFPWHYV